MNHYPTGSFSRYNGATNVSIYKKAIEIFGLSRSLTRDLTSGASVLDMHRSSEPLMRYSDTLLIAALGLAPKIAMAESTPDLQVKISSIRSLRKSTSTLLQYCELLETHSQQKREFLRRLRLEIIRFRRMQRDWANRICSSN